MDHVYLKGSILDTTNLVVYSVWSDGVQEKITNGYTVTSNDGASSVKLTTVGTQTVTVASSGFDSKTTNISVIDTTPTAVDGKLYVNVDADFTASYNGAQVNGVETFTSVKDAIDYLEACVADNSSLADVQKVVRIGAGTYKAKITTDLKNLALIGTATKTVNSNTVVDPNATVLTYDAVESTVNPVNGTQYSLECATLQVNGSGFTAYNITIKNSFNYIADSKKESSPQGIALTINGDQAVISNCVLYGNQDTLYLKKGRAYFKDTEIDGNIDFIFGESTGLAYFDTCTIKAITKSTAKEKNNGYVTAMKASSENKPDYGYIFSNCTFTDDGNLADGSMSLGRPWGAAATVAYINCSFTKAYSTAAYDGTTKSRWYEMSGNSPVNADFCEYGSTGDGAITTAVTGGKVLTTEQAANYTKANIFAKENGKCSWSAAWDCGAAYDAVANLKVLDTATELYVSSTSITVNEKETAALAISVNKWNASDKGVTIEVANPAIATYSNGKVTGVAAGTTTITVSKSGFESKTVTVNVAPADLTISETLSTYVFGTQLPPEVTTANTTSYLGKIKIDTGTSGTFVKHDDNYYKLMGTASITLKVKAGSILTLATYDNELALTLNGTDVTANGAYSATSGDCTYTYTVAADGDLVLKLADGKNQLYLTSLGVYVPTVISKTTVLDLTTTDGATEALKYINVNGTMTENSSGGNYRVERGTVLTIYAAKGSTAAITWYSDTEVQYGSDNNVSIVTTDSTDYTVITLTFHADTDETRNDGSNGCYIKKITVTAPQAAQPASKTYTYTYGETNGSEWVATTTNYQNNPNDATISGLLLAPNDYLTLTASGTSATITLTGFTRKTNTPGEWVTVEFLDAEGNVVGSCKGTPPSNKNNDKIFDAKTFSCESGKSFTKIRVTCNTADKNFSVSAATIVVE
jgi:pectin methylesterase-like acyl-CoA thioesterase